MSFVIGIKHKWNSELLLVGENNHRLASENLAQVLYHRHSLSSVRVIEVDLAGRIAGEVFNEIMKIERNCKHLNVQATFDEGMKCTNCGLRIREFDKDKIIAGVTKTNVNLNELEELELNGSWR